MSSPSFKTAKISWWLSRGITPVCFHAGQLATSFEACFTDCQKAAFGIFSGVCVFSSRTSASFRAQSSQRMAAFCTLSLSVSSVFIAMRIASFRHWGSSKRLDSRSFGVSRVRVGLLVFIVNSDISLNTYFDGGDCNSAGEFVDLVSEDPDRIWV